MTSETVLRFQLGDSVVEFSAERPELNLAIQHIYAAFLVGDRVPYASSLNGLPSGVTWRASVDGRDFAYSEFYYALRMLEDIVAERLLRGVASCLLIHSAAVKNEDLNIFIVGRSKSGKTTTALELVRRGMRYVTDEFTAIESCGTVIRPFPRGAVRKFDGPTPPGVNLTIPDEPGFRAHLLPDCRSSLEPSAAQPCRIIFPRYEEGVSPSARLLTTAECCIRLMPSIFDFRGREKEVWPTLANVATSARACEFTYSDAATDLDLALGILG